MQTSMFAHVLCIREDSSTQLSAVVGSAQCGGRVGRHTTNLLDTLHSDLRVTGVRLRIHHDIYPEGAGREQNSWDGTNSRGTDCDIRCSPDYLCCRNSTIQYHDHLVIITPILTLLSSLCFARFSGEA